MDRVLYLCLTLTTPVFCVYSPTKETEIRTETVLAATYDSVSRPSATTTVTVGINLLAIDEVDLPAQKFSAAGWVTMEWEDDRLVWTPSSKDDIDRIFATPATIWKPELMVDNSVDELGIIADSNLLLSVESDGAKATVEWDPPMLFIVHCEIDITYYPYDQQKCGIEIVSWGYSTSEVILQHMFTGLNLEDYQPNGEWEVVKTDVTTSTITETRNGVTKSFSQLEFWIHLKRRDQFYNTNVMLPIILSSILVTLVFLVPVESGEKLSYILTVLLIIAVFLTIIGDTLPAISLTTSVLGIFLASTLCIATLATFFTVGILFIYHKKGEPRVGSVIYILSRGMGKLCCMPYGNGFPSNSQVEPTEVVRSKSTSDGEKSRPGSATASDQSLSWTSIALIWDRFCFVVFVVVTFIANVVFILVLSVGGANSSTA